MRLPRPWRKVSRRTREESTVEDWWGVPGSGVPAFPLESEPGDLVVFNHCLKHSSWGGGTRRRMFTINMQQRHAEEDLEALREDIAASARFWIERAYGEVMVRTAGPARMRHSGAAPRQRRAPRRALPQGPRRDERAKPGLRIAIGYQLLAGSRRASLRPPPQSRGWVLDCGFRRSDGERGYIRHADSPFLEGRGRGLGPTRPGFPRTPQ